MKGVFPFVVFLSGLVFFQFSCNQNLKTADDQTTVQAKQLPVWAKNSGIYEVNIRQYTSEGTINAFSHHLPRLEELGVDILWLMPIYPVGLKNRKGSLGSPYSVKNYMEVNPELGSLGDLKNLVNLAHQNGMHVILDWVANHTSWDNDLISKHPDWYSRDSSGNIVPPVPDWSDVADLNYDKKELWYYMKDAMKFWIDSAGIDGFRCDVAGMVPTEFWNWAIPELEQTKPLFMLAEAEDVALLEKAFDMDYNWTLLHLQNDIAAGKKNTSDLAQYLIKQQNEYSPEDLRMNFITNHDENSWNGTAPERLGEAIDCFTVLDFTLPGMPLVYSGQESGLCHSLSFFEKDSIAWKPDPMAELYRRLFQAKKTQKALWNGIYGGDLKLISGETSKNLLAFSRKKDQDKLVAFFNFSPEVISIPNLFLSPVRGWNVLITNGSTDLETKNYTLAPWGYLVLVSGE